jgi:hypothetical protein
LYDSGVVFLVLAAACLVAAVASGTTDAYLKGVGGGLVALIFAPLASRGAARTGDRDWRSRLVILVCWPSRSNRPPPASFMRSPDGTADEAAACCLQCKPRADGSNPKSRRITHLIQPSEEAFSASRRR